jgi:small subunit ribosomal protein S16
MLTLRLSRAGTKKRPVYHLVATDSRNRRDGRFVENLGYFIPNKDIIVLKHDRIEYWLGVGAAVSDTAKHVIAKSKRNPAAVAPPKPKARAPMVKKPAADAQTTKTEAQA